MAQKRFDEYFAKVVLQSCFPKRFADLKISDKPDLRCGNEIGIEVTNCMPKEAAEAFSLWRKVERLRDKTPQRIWERLEQLKDTVHLVGNELIWEQDAYINDDIDNSPIKEFTKAVAKKIERLNSINADYDDMGSYELFANSFIYVSTYKQIIALLKRTTELNDKPKKCDNIYLVTGGQKLIVFDLVNNTFDIKYLYNQLDRMANKAIELYREAKQ